MSDLQPFPDAQAPHETEHLVTLMVCAIIGSVLLLVFALYSVQITRATRDDVKDTALGIARTLADSPEIQRGLMQAPRRILFNPSPRRSPGATTCSSPSSPTCAVFVTRTRTKPC